VESLVVEGLRWDPFLHFVFCMVGIGIAFSEVFNRVFYNHEHKTVGSMWNIGPLSRGAYTKIELQKSIFFLKG
jgi:hypothetical protein